MHTKDGAAYFATAIIHMHKMFMTLAKVANCINYDADKIKIDGLTLKTGQIFLSLGKQA
jgi:hypothetical protein